MERLPHERFQTLARDVVVPNTDHAAASSFEVFRTGGIVGLSVTPVVRVALEFQHEPFGDAIEVHDEAVQDMLAAEP